MVVLVGARVLIGPFDGEDRALVVVETSDVVATAVVVLRVKESVGVVPVPPGLIETVVGTPVISGGNCAVKLMYAVQKAKDIIFLLWALLGCMLFTNRHLLHAPF